jgi:hypothetical protein
VLPVVPNLRPPFILNFLEAAKEHQLKDRISVDIDVIKTGVRRFD